MYKYMGALVLCLVLLLNFGLAESVQANAEPPHFFRDCSKENKEGDLSYPYGSYTTPELGYYVNGKNDIYEFGIWNYYQCVCAVGNNASVQANWWKVDGVDEAIIQSYVNQGWVRANGLDWNMRAGSYLVKNNTYTCGNNNPTPTGWITPTSVPSPTMSVVPTPTVTPVVEKNESGSGIGGPINHSAPVCNDPVLRAPVVVSVVKSDKDSVDLAWTNVQEADDYMISYGVESGNYIYGVPSTGRVTSYRIGALDLNKHYYFQVRAIRGCMPGDPSNELEYPQSLAIGGQVLGLAATSGIELGLYAMVVGSGISSAVWLWRRYAKTI